MRVSSLTVMSTKTHFGDEFYIFSLAGRRCWVPASIARGPSPKLLEHLAHHNLMLTEKDAAHELREKVADAKPYSGPAPISRPGWNGHDFGWPDGSVIGGEGVEAPVATYQATSFHFEQSGTLEDWQRLASPLGSQPLTLFMMALPLAAPLRSLINPLEDLVFELVASGRADPAFPGLLIGSVTGGVTDAGIHYAPFHSAVYTPCQTDPYTDQLLVLGEIATFMAGEAASARAARVRARISHHVRSIDDPWVRPATTLLIGQKRMAALVGEDTDIGRLASERILTLNVAPERRHGWLDSLPDDFNSLPQYFLHLRAVIGSNHGVVLRKFIAELAKHFKENKAELLRRIAQQMRLFREKTGCDLGDAQAVRDADAFGVVYTAAWLAREWSLLPENWHPGPMLIELYSNFYSPRKPAKSFDQELAELLTAPDVLHVKMGKKPDLAVIDAAKVIAKQCADHLELIIRPEHINDLIPNWMQRKNDPEIGGMLMKEKGEAGQAKIYRRWVSETQRVYCFMLSLNRLQQCK